MCLSAVVSVSARGKYDNTDTITVARDGSGEFRNVSEAVGACRAFMEYKKVIYVKNGTYKEKVVVPSWLTNIEIVGEDRDKTVITYDDHANINLPGTTHHMGTFRTYTVKVEGTNITFKNITIENNAPKLGQAVALHTEGDRLVFINCRILGNQDTIYTGTPALVFTSSTVSLMARRTLYSVRRWHGSRTASCRAVPTRMLLQHQHLRTRSSDTFSITAA